MKIDNMNFFITSHHQSSFVLVYRTISIKLFSKNLFHSKFGSFLLWLAPPSLHYSKFNSFFVSQILLVLKISNIASLINIIELLGFPSRLIINQDIITKLWIIVFNSRHLIPFPLIFLIELNMSTYPNLVSLRLKDPLSFRK